MRQEFQETVRLAGTRQAVWATVSDIPTVLSWISIVGGAEAVEPGTRYARCCRTGWGRSSCARTSTSRSRARRGERIHARGDGEDRQIGSRLIIDVTLALSDDGAGRRSTFAAPTR